jgi:2-oxoglutarate ferredoxin oxidoreductase subunit beta
MDMVVMLFDNSVYGLTKKQTSPTTPQGFATNTHPRGAWLPPLNPVRTMLGFPNVSFVARTVDWNPLHLHQTLLAAYHHRGMGFVHVLQRCPTYTPEVFEELRTNPDLTLLMTHETGIPAGDAVLRTYRNQAEHDPSDLEAARALADRNDCLPIGLFYRDANAVVYDDYTNEGIGTSDETKLSVLAAELDRFAI